MVGKAKQLSYRHIVHRKLSVAFAVNSCHGFRETLIDDRQWVEMIRVTNELTSQSIFQIDCQPKTQY